jgi:hypothetical protein
MLDKQGCTRACTRLRSRAPARKKAKTRSHTHTHTHTHTRNRVSRTRLSVTLHVHYLSCLWFSAILRASVEIIHIRFFWCLILDNKNKIKIYTLQKKGFSHRQDSKADCLIHYFSSACQEHFHKSKVAGTWISHQTSPNFVSRCGKCGIYVCVICV